MTKLSLKLLDNDPRNSNVCSSETLEKLQRNIERTGLYPPLIVRPTTGRSKRYVIIDGHHRKQVLEALGHTEAECLIWDISEQEARIALATLNTLRGTENLKKRAELLQELSQVLPVTELAQFIPESTEEIQDLLALLAHDIEELEKSLQAQTAAEKNSLPIPFTFLIAADDQADVEEALSRFMTSPKPDRGIALVNLCRFALKHTECAHGDAERE